jgi:hypothetical protein
MNKNMYIGDYLQYRSHGLIQGYFVSNIKVISKYIRLTCDVYPIKFYWFKI